MNKLNGLQGLQGLDYFVDGLGLFLCTGILACSF